VHVSLLTIPVTVAIRNIQFPKLYFIKPPQYFSHEYALDVSRCVISCIRIQYRVDYFAFKAKTDKYILIKILTIYDTGPVGNLLGSRILRLELCPLGLNSGGGGGGVLQSKPEILAILDVTRHN
jgi:hypothetical protein